MNPSEKVPALANICESLLFISMNTYLGDQGIHGHLFLLVVQQDPAIHEFLRSNGTISLERYKIKFESRYTIKRLNRVMDLLNFNFFTYQLDQKAQPILNITKKRSKINTFAVDLEQENDGQKTESKICAANRLNFNHLYLPFHQLNQLGHHVHAFLGGQVNLLA